MTYSSWLPWLLCALTAASLTRLITADSLLQWLRTRWETHWLGAIDAVLVEADSHLQVARGSTDPQKVGLLRQEINKRANTEAGVPMWLTGARRRARRPWSTRRERLEQLEIYANFISCPWCLSFWVMALCVLWTWGRVYGFSGDVFAPVGVPVDYALLALALGLRWLYGLVAVNLEGR